MRQSALDAAKQVATTRLSPAMTLTTRFSPRYLRALLSAALVLFAMDAAYAQRLPAVDQVSEYTPLPGASDASLLEVEANTPPAGPAPVYYDATQLPDDGARMSALEKKIKDLEKQVKANAPKKAAPGEWEDLSAEKWTVKLGGHVQADYITWAQASPTIVGDQNYFEFRRLRLVADGTGYGVYDFRLQMTLEPETVGENPPGAATSPEIKDAYFSINELPWLGRLRVGHFFVPFSLEQVTNDTNNIFLERSIPTQGIFSGDREVGLAQYNHSADYNVSWASGIFFDSVSDALKERIDDNQGYRISGRLNWLPYYDEPSGGRYLVHTGIGILHTNDLDDRVRFRARPQIHEGPRLIDSGSLAADTYTTGNLEFAWVNGPMTIQSEAFISSVDLDVGGPTTVNGMYAHLSYFLTGENRNYERFGQHGAQFGRNQPYSNVFAVDGCRSWGAWEAKIRTSYLDLDPVDGGQYQDLTAGFNWYWSDRVRVMFDWIHPWTTADTPFGTADADILGTRFDFNW
jgi:phosphate-selective porin OprO and OprP